MILYLKSIFMYIKCDMEYKVSFILTLITSTLSSLFAFIGTIILIHTFGSIDGWTLNEILFTTGLAYFGNSLTEMFGRGLDHFHKQVKDGLLDKILVRPRSITLQVLCSDFEFSKIGRLTETLILLIYGVATIGINWTPYKVLVLFLMMAGSCVLFFSILLIKASFSFWTIEGMELMNILSDGGKQLSSYPITIFKKWFADIFTYIIPFGCVNYFPLIYLLDKGDNPFWYGLLPLFTIVFLFTSFGVWKLGLNSYKSTGS